MAQACRSSVPGSRPATISRRGVPSASALADDHAQPIGVLFERQRARPARRPHPLDRHRAASRADVPEQRVGHGRQCGDGCRAHLALGDLPVVNECIIGQSRRARQKLRARLRDALDGERVQIGYLTITRPSSARKLVWCSCGPPMFSSTVTVLAHSRGRRAGARLRPTVVASAVSTSRRAPGWMKASMPDAGPAVQRQGIGVGKRPAHPRRGERESRNARQHGDFARRHDLQELSRHPVVEGIAGCQHHGIASTQRPDPARPPR